MQYGIMAMEYITLFLYLSASLSIVRVRKFLSTIQVVFFSVPIILTVYIILNALTSQNHLKLATLSILLFLSYIYYYLAYNLKSKFYNPTDSYENTLKNRVERFINNDSTLTSFSSLKGLLELPIGQENHISKKLLFERKQVLSKDLAMFRLIMMSGSRTGFYHHDVEEKLIVDTGSILMHLKYDSGIIKTFKVFENEHFVIPTGIPHDMEATEFAVIRCHFKKDPNH